jgi:hypothetical protein
MRFSAFLLSFVLLVFSCTGSDESKVVLIEQPDDLIPRDKMIPILADVHLLEACLQYRSPQVASRTPVLVGPEMLEKTVLTPLPNDQKTMPYYEIFAKHGCTRDQYERSMRWYMTDAALYGEMYDEVINELIRRQAYEQGGVEVPADTTK